MSDLADKARRAYSEKLMNERLDAQREREEAERRIWTQASHYTRKVMGLKDGEMLVLEPVETHPAKVRFGVSGLGELVFEYRRSHADALHQGRREYLGVLTDPTRSEQAAHYFRELGDLMWRQLPIKKLGPNCHEVKDLADVGRWL